MMPFQLSFVAVNAENLQSFLPVLSSTPDIDPASQLVLGCLCNGVPCGLAAARLVDSFYAELIWFEVVGGLRRRKIGSALLQTLASCLKRAGAVQLSASCNSTVPQAEELRAFLSKHGFDPPVTTQIVFFANFKDVLPAVSGDEAQLPPQVKNGVQPLAHLSVQSERALKRAVHEGRIPAFVLPENASGSFLEEYSLAYAETQSINAVVMYSELPKVLCLDGVYLNRLRHTEGMHLVLYSLNKALKEYKAAEVLAVDSINPQSLALVSHFADRIPCICEYRSTMRKKL